MESFLSLLITAAAFSAVSTPPVDKHDMIIRSREGEGVSVGRWTINGELKDGRPVVFILDFSHVSKTIKVGLIVAGKSWGEHLIDRSKFPMIDIRSLTLNQFQGHIQLIFDYGPKGICPGGVDAELTVDFNLNAVRLFSEQARCP